MVSYKGNRYQVDVGVMDAHQRIRIEDDGEMLLFYDTETTAKIDAKNLMKAKELISFENFCSFYIKRIY